MSWQLDAGHHNGQSISNTTVITCFLAAKTDSADGELILGEPMLYVFLFHIFSCNG